MRFLAATSSPQTTQSLATAGIVSFLPNEAAERRIVEVCVRGEPLLLKGVVGIAIGCKRNGKLGRFHEALRERVGEIRGFCRA